MKLCKDCKWCKSPKFLWVIPMPEGIEQCMRPSWKLCDPVNGKRTATFCGNQRDFNRTGMCGSDAKYFEAK